MYPRNKPTTQTCLESTLAENGPGGPSARTSWTSGASRRQQSTVSKLEHCRGRLQPRTFEMQLATKLNSMSTYTNFACNYSRINTYSLKDLKARRINTCRKITNTSVESNPRRRTDG